MNRADTVKKILVIRNDKIGDFMLAWPSFALLKKQYPEAEITALVPEYTADLAHLCEWIDHVLIDEKKASFISDVTSLKNKIKEKQFDASISLFSEARTSIALWLAGVKQRIGPATKIAQIFLNRRLRQKRSRSAKPEYEYNLDLIKYYIHLSHDGPVEPPPPPYLVFDPDEIESLRNEIRLHYGIADDSRIVIIHPGTGGSAINLSTDQYASLAKRLSVLGKLFFIITAGPGELSRATDLSKKLHDINHGLHESRTGIIDFCKYINTADIFISGSTGPLHIAGALNINTVAFYPAKRSATFLRWQTVNNEDRRIDFSPEKFRDRNDMQTIDISACARDIISFYKIGLQH